jgi:3-mercaptopyruvate sulfurtransferase SseA
LVEREGRQVMSRGVAGWVMAAAVLVAPAAMAPVGAQYAETAESVPRTKMVEFRKLLEQKAVVAIDVRPSEAYRAGHVPGALSFPLETVPTKIELLRGLGKPIVAYCS